MIVVDQAELVLEFMRREIGQAPHKDTCRVFGWANARGIITGGLAYYNANLSAVTVDLALTEPWTRKFLFLTFWYPFHQLRVKRLTIPIAASNLKCINLVERLGAYREATLQDGCSDGDMHIYCLRHDKCPIWSKLCEKRFIQTRSA